MSSNSLPRSRSSSHRLTSSGSSLPSRVPSSQFSLPGVVTGPRTSLRPWGNNGPSYAPPPLSSSPGFTPRPGSSSSSGQMPSSVRVGLGGAQPMANAVSGNGRSTNGGRWEDTGAGSTANTVVGGQERVRENTLSEWSFFGVDITIVNLKQLAEENDTFTEELMNQSHVERDAETGINGSVGGGSASRSASAIGNREIGHWSFGSDRWKLELLHPPTQPSIIPTSPTSTESHPLSQSKISQSLSLYLTCHVLESDYYPWSDFSIPVIIMVGVRPPTSSSLYSASSNTSNGRVQRNEWVWREWEHDWFFARENEVWECHTFPTLKHLLKNERIRDADAFTLSIQIQSPAESVIPQLRGLQHVPRDLLTGVESLLDDPGTGDVRILVHERQPASIVFPMNASEEEAFAYRKRALYGHSALLKSRSEYFAAMLAGGWREGGGKEGEEGETKKMFTVVIDDFDFITVYWLLHWIYTNDLTLLSQDDIRSQPLLSISAPAALSLALSDMAVNPLGWDWQYLPPVSSNDDMDASSHSSVSERSVSRLSSHSVHSTVHSNVGSSIPIRKKMESKLAFGTTIPPSIPPVMQVQRRVAPSGGTPGKRRAASGNLPRETIMGDPHPHPCPAPAPASAFSMYRLAHRYQISDLENIALKHLVDNLSPSTAFPLLLATHSWPELHSAIKGYALNNYYAIVAEPEFRRCYAEVGEGLWEDGGQVLLEFTLALAPAGNEV